MVVELFAAGEVDDRGPPCEEGDNACERGDGEEDDQTVVGGVPCDGTEDEGDGGENEAAHEHLAGRDKAERFRGRGFVGGGVGVSVGVGGFGVVVVAGFAVAVAGFVAMVVFVAVVFAVVRVVAAHLAALILGEHVGDAVGDGVGVVAGVAAEAAGDDFAIALFIDGEDEGSVADGTDEAFEEHVLHGEMVAVFRASVRLSLGARYGTVQSERRMGALGE